MTQTRLALLLLAVGCSTEGSGTESATATSDPSGPYVVPPDEPQTPDLNDAAVAAGGPAARARRGRGEEARRARRAAVEAAITRPRKRNQSHRNPQIGVHGPG